MNLFKLKSCDNLEFLLDIIFNERLFCCSYDKLNDPFEGIFLSTFSYNNPFVRGLREVTQNLTVDDVIIDASHRNVCSLSSSAKDVRLWSHYAGGHQGVAIEIDFSGLEKEIHTVSYPDSLLQFGNTILTLPTNKEVLTTKTAHWRYESEVRIIQENEYFDIKDRIVGIHLGIRASENIEKILKAAINERFPVVRAQLNYETVEIKLEKFNKARHSTSE